MNQINEAQRRNLDFSKVVIHSSVQFLKLLERHGVFASIVISRAKNTFPRVFRDHLRFPSLQLPLTFVREEGRQSFFPKQHWTQNTEYVLVN